MRQRLESSIQTPGQGAFLETGIRKLEAKVHRSVLLQETIDGLQLKKGDLAIDATCGAGGHTKEVAQRVGQKGRVLAIDRDKNSLNVARSVFRGENVTYALAEFADINKVAKANGFFGVNAILADLGVSSMQLDDPTRGFSLKSRGVLDMRMDTEKSEVTAYDIVNHYEEKALVDIFFKYGEEKYSRQVAKAIVDYRKENRIEYTDQLAEVVRGVIRAQKARRVRKQNIKNRTSRIDPATKIFQAIRIEVNQELKQLESALPQMVDLLLPGGKLAIISFHSLEDRIVKDFFKKSSLDCVCPPDFPKCQCDHVKKLKVITKKAIKPTAKEMLFNPRSRSAKLRIAEKIN